MGCIDRPLTIARLPTRSLPATSTGIDATAEKARFIRAVHELKFISRELSVKKKALEFLLVVA